MISVALIGYGYWGKKLFRNLNDIQGVIVKSVIDIDKKKLTTIASNFPEINIHTNYKYEIEENNIDAIIIATPSSSHYKIAKLALQNNKHVFIEKPMATSLKKVIELEQLAIANKKIIQVDHTFLYTPSVITIKKIIESKKLGEILFFDSTRINYGIFQSDVNVLWDLAVHDIAIMTYLIEDEPISVQAMGISHTQNNIENIAYITLRFNDNKIAHFNCSWSFPMKIRKILIGGEKKMIIYDDLEPIEKVKIYNTNIKNDLDSYSRGSIVNYSYGDLFIPKLNNTEALYNILNDFFLSIKTNKQPISNGSFGVKVVKILEATQMSIKQRGKEIYL